MAYTPPSRAAVDFDFTEAYSAPLRSAVDLSFTDPTVKLRVSAKGPLEIANAVQVTTAGNAAQASAPGPLEASNDILVEAAVESVQLRASALGPLDLMSAEAVTQHAIGARSSAPGPLDVSDPIDVTMAGNAAQASAPGPLDAANPIDVTMAGNAAQASAPGPLDASDPVQITVEVPVQMFVSAPDPLTAQASAVTLAGNAAQSSAPGPLETSNPIQVLGDVEQVAQVSAPGPLDAMACAGYVWHDFSDVVGDEEAQFYVVDFELIAGTVRVPMSSWQATIQSGRSSYVQVVIPASTAYFSTLETAVTEGADMVIYKGVRLHNGDSVLQELARGPTETVRFDQGPFRATATVSGYADAFVPAVSPPAITDRTLQHVRSVSSGSGGDTRVRCAIDWFLRPGYLAIVTGTGAREFTVDYVNYYVNERDAYMDVGERSA